MRLSSCPAKTRGHLQSTAIPTCSTPGSPPPSGHSPPSVGRSRPRNCSTATIPTTCSISGFDIIFFWDARMAMQGFEFMEERYHGRRLYLHGLVRDGRRLQKMSKSKGNTVDPLGPDRPATAPMRCASSLAAMESQGRDIKLDEKRVEGYRNFATKLWNAARFCQANGIGASQLGIEAPAGNDLRSTSWIIGEVVETLGQARCKAIAEHAFRCDGRRHLPVHLGHLLRLVSGTHQARTSGRRGFGCRRNSRGCRLGARPDSGHAPPVHALHHRRTMARPG